MFLRDCERPECSSAIVSGLIPTFFNLKQSEALLFFEPRDQRSDYTASVSSAPPAPRSLRTSTGESLRSAAPEPTRSVWNSQNAIRAVAQGELHEDLLEQGATRLSGIYAISSVSFAIFIAFSLSTGAAFADFPGVLALELTALSLSLGALLLNTFGKLRPQAARDIGYVFLVLICLLLSLLRYGDAIPSTQIFAHISPSVFPILGFAALIPAAPKAALLVSLAAAAMDPLALAFMWNDAQTASASTIVLSIASPFFAAFMAHHIARVVHRLSQRIESAQEIGSYELVERLGRGGMAEVWRAQHRMLARPAAIKVIRSEVLLGHGPVAAERLVNLFLREARTTAQMSSPNTIQIYDFGITREGAFYYVMELLEGVDLQVLVKTFGPQTAERTTHLLRQVCRSLAEAHEHNFVHRDVKPANVFTCRYGGEADFVKVLDFGLVLDRHPTVEELSDEQKFVGTPAIMAPEMVRFQSPVDARADLYAVGCVGYWLLTGHRVFEAETRQDMLVMHAHQKPTTPSHRLGHDIHAGLEQIIMTCLEKNPDRRPQSARELGELLDALQFELPWSSERAALWWRRHDPTQSSKQEQSTEPLVDAAS